MSIETNHMQTNISIRSIRESDLAEFKALRLEALRTESRGVRESRISRSDSHGILNQPWIESEFAKRCTIPTGWIDRRRRRGSGTGRNGLGSTETRGRNAVMRRGYGAFSFARNIGGRNSASG